MKKTILSLFAMLFVSSCGSIGTVDTSSKPLTVDDLETMKKQKPDEFKAKYQGKTVVVVGKMIGNFYDDPGAFQNLGFQNLTVKGESGTAVFCEVKASDGEKLKGVKAGDVVTVTGQLEATDVTFTLHNCSKFAGPK